MKDLTKWTVLLSAIGIVASCASTRIKYSSDIEDPSSPPDGGFAFALRASTVVLAPRSATSAKAAPASGNDVAALPLSASVADAPAPKAGAASDTDLCASAKPADKKSPDACIDALAVSVAPVSTDDAVYIAAPDKSWHSKTSLTPKVSGTDPLLLNTVAVNTVSTFPSAITSAGAGGATGFAWGPWGAVLGAAGGFVTGLTAPAQPTEVHVSFAGDEGLAWLSAVCNGARDRARYSSLPQDVLLHAPVTVDYKSADASACWTALPSAGDTNAGQRADPSEDDPQARATGWFYRFVPNAKTPKRVTRLPPEILNDSTGQLILPSGVLPTADYFKSEKDSKWTGTKASVPASACRAVELQLVWWSQLASSVPVDARPAQMRVYHFPLVVADPAYVQSVTAPTRGTVTLLPVCGAYANSGAASSEASDSINALFKQIQAIKSAQSTWATKK